MRMRFCSGAGTNLGLFCKVLRHFEQFKSFFGANFCSPGRDESFKHRAQTETQERKGEEGERGREGQGERERGMRLF